MAAQSDQYHRSRNTVGLETSVKEHNYNNLKHKHAESTQQLCWCKIKPESANKIFATMSGAVETELRKLEKIVPGLLKTNEKMEMVSFFLNGHKYLKEERIPLNLEPRIGTEMIIRRRSLS